MVPVATLGIQYLWMDWGQEGLDQQMVSRSRAPAPSRGDDQMILVRQTSHPLGCKKQWDFGLCNLKKLNLQKRLAFFLDLDTLVLMGSCTQLVRP